MLDLPNHSDLERKLAAYVVMLGTFYETKCNKWDRKKPEEGGRVESENDWKMLEYLYEVFRLLHPDQAKIFIESQEKVRKNLKDEEYGDASPEKANESVRHLMNMPQKLHELFHKCYPNQKYDRKFVIQLCKRMPVFSIPKKM